MAYNHELDNWPEFTWKDEILSANLADVRHRQSRFIERMESLNFQLRAESVLYSLTEEAVKSSDIEGEHVNKDQVRSSISRRLGMDIAGMVQSDMYADGVVKMVIDATQNYRTPLTEERLFDWHSTLFPSGRSGMSKITVGDWRSDKSGPMQIVSGPMGREIVHYEAPAAELLPDEMRTFLRWFENDKDIDPVLVAGVAHLWFVAIHPFDDGNGRIARAITEMALARSEDSPQRFYSMSSAIRIHRKSYYDILERTQKGGLDITKWLDWFLKILDVAFDQAEHTLSTVLAKTEFWNVHRNTQLNERQKKVINRLLDGFIGKLTSNKWAKMTKTSQDTALRDIDDLIKKGILVRSPAGGQSISYELI